MCLIIGRKFYVHGCIKDDGIFSIIRNCQYLGLKVWNPLTDWCKKEDSYNWTKKKYITVTFVIRSSKRYTKLENWYSQMQLKLVEEIVRNIKKKIKSIDAYEVELWHFNFLIVKFLVLRKWVAKLLLLKIL